MKTIVSEISGNVNYENTLTMAGARLIGPCGVDSLPAKLAVSK